MTDTTKPLTQGEILNAAMLIEGCRNTARVMWGVNGDVTRVIHGHLRAIMHNNVASGESTKSEDIRDLWVWITATMEFWLPVSQVLEQMAEGTFVFEVD